MTQTIIVALTTGFFNLNFWYSYILFLIIIGGILVLFIYITRVASNEKFTFSIKITIFLIIITSIIIITLFVDTYFTNINTLNLESLPTNTIFSISLNKFINYPINIILFILILYLLLALIAVVKITDIKKGPLRQTSN